MAGHERGEWRAMTPAELDAFVAGYFCDRAAALSESRADRLEFESAPDHPSWALDRLLVDPSDAEEGWPILLALIDRAPNEHDLSFLAAGPLERLVHLHGEQFGDRIVERARQDRRFREALRGVWGWETVAEPLRGRLLELLGPTS